ncbi:MAG: hypothetical protein PUK70_09060, partial [Bacteroidales bacterium]|nr:hypothetical protein [Bacteroidales bacterium]MDY6001061.1 hypothetical protein [Candidatus Cryptobacteroides sp.]
VMLPPDEHTTKVAIRCGTPKFRKRSASHTVVGQVWGREEKKCGKQEKLSEETIIGIFVFQMLPDYFSLKQQSSGTQKVSKSPLQQPGDLFSM